MPIEMNTRKIIKKYHGTKLVYEDIEGRWKNLKMSDEAGGKEAQFLAVAGVLVFRPQSTKISNNSTNDQNFHTVITIPPKFKDLKPLNDFAVITDSGGDVLGLQISVDGNSVRVKNNGGGYVPVGSFMNVHNFNMKDVILSYTI
ncbi:hypothetical protein [Secundilactobacillus kimchicus]|uniref:hypothetical protein n=1 Tax=Secundilactobacillus kimchicus TaxID=528209 RepID=UPI0024A9DDD2|nr:hypothetical protein [Secundilactobacillus kimchicus]